MNTPKDTGWEEELEELWARPFIDEHFRPGAIRDFIRSLLHTQQEKIIGLLEGMKEEVSDESIMLKEAVGFSFTESGNELLSDAILAIKKQEQ